jgi:hypothetical protein
MEIVVDLPEPVRTEQAEHFPGSQPNAAISHIANRWREIDRSTI